MSETVKTTAVTNLINGQPVTSPVVLKKILDLDITGDLMINIGADFTGALRTPNAGMQLAATMIQARINFMHRAALKDYLERILLLSQIGRPAVQIGNVEDLIPTRDRLLQWFARGWTMKVDTINMAPDDFLDWVQWKIQRETRISLENDIAVCKREIATKLEVTP